MPTRANIAKPMIDSTPVNSFNRATSIHECHLVVDTSTFNSRTNSDVVSKDKNPGCVPFFEFEMVDAYTNRRRCEKLAELKWRFDVLFFGFGGKVEFS